MTHDELYIIEARANAASGEKWVAGNTRMGGHTFYFIYRDDETRTVLADLSASNQSANADFIANARTDIPALIAEVRRLQAEREQIAAAVESVPITIWNQNVIEPVLAILNRENE